MSRIKSEFATRKELEKLDERIQKMSGFNMMLINHRTFVEKIKIEQRIIKNEIKALNKRIDKLNKDRALSGMKIK